jgi:uncharacterized membrane protein
MSDELKSPETGATPKGTSETPRGLGRWERRILVVSLGLNVLVIAAISAAVLSGARDGGRHSSGREVASPYIGAFERSDKRAMRDLMRMQLPDRRETRGAIRADMFEFVALLRAESFDAAAALELMERQFARTQSVQALGRELSVERISAMTRTERLAYADRFEALLERSKGKPGKPGKERGPGQ